MQPQARSRSQIGRWKGLGTPGKGYIVLNEEVSSCDLKYVGDILGPVVTRVAYFEDPSEKFPVTALEFRENDQKLGDLERENSELRRFVEQHPPHKQALRTAVAFLIFFSAVLVVQLLAGISLISAALAWTGIAVSAATILLSYLALLDWRDWRDSLG
jgi:hypothetical protein